MKRATGLIRQGYDGRDLRYIAESSRPESSVDLRDKFLLIENQGNLNSCTSHAVGDLMNYFLAEKKKYAKWPHFRFSKAYLWYYARQRINRETKNSGAILRDCFKVITNEGFVKESDWDFSKPYNEPTFSVKLASKFYKLYLGQLPKYYRIDDNASAKLCLNDGLPFVFGFPITKDFEILKKNVVYKHDIEYLQTGLHAMLVVGYNNKGFIVRNSWGEKWADKGYCIIDFDSFEKFSFDKWTLK